MSGAAVVGWTIAASSTSGAVSCSPETRGGATMTVTMITSANEERARRSDGGLAERCIDYGRIEPAQPYTERATRGLDQLRGRARSPGAILPGPGHHPSRAAHRRQRFAPVRAGGGVRLGSRRSVRRPPRPRAPMTALPAPRRSRRPSPWSTSRKPPGSPSAIMPAARTSTRCRRSWAAAPRRSTTTATTTSTSTSSTTATARPSARRRDATACFAAKRTAATPTSPKRPASATPAAAWAAPSATSTTTATSTCS